MSDSAQGLVASKPLLATLAQKPKRGQQSGHIRYPFWFGGSASSMAACFTHPLDLIKVRLQNATLDTSRSVIGVIAKIYKSNGALGFYSGISAALVRQMTYSTVRFALYEEFKQRSGPQISTPALIAAAAYSGFAGGIAGNFADVLNVRMQNDTALHVDKRRGYKHVFDGLIKMTREEGFLSCFRGWLPNSTRAAVQTAGQLAGYDAIKRVLMGDESNRCGEDANDVGLWKTRDLGTREYDVEGVWSEVGSKGVASKFPESWAAYHLYIYVLRAAPKAI